MFEQSLLVEKRRRPRLGKALASALLLHGAGFGAVLAAGVWTVPAVEAPTLAEIYVDFVPQPPAASGLPEAQPEPAAAPPDERPPAEPPVSQPEDVPQDVPAEAPPAPPPVVSAVPVDPLAPAGGPGRGPREGVPWGDPDAPAGPGHGDGGAGDAPIELDARMIAPVTLHRVQPLYTEAARRARTQGFVILQATIDRTGHVTDVRVLKPLPFGLDDAAVQAVRQWRFTPATLQGRPVPVYFRLTVQFRVQ